MTVLDWPDGFKWPYAGFEVHPPREFSRDMVRYEDQIYWLLAAIEKLNAFATSEKNANAYADEVAAKSGKKAEEYAERLYNVLDKLVGDLEKKVDGIEKGIAIARDPATGRNEYIYNALHHLYDLMRPHSLTWDELTKSGRTWDDVAALGVSYYEFEANAAIIVNGDDTQRYRTSDYDIATPGYIPALFTTGTSWEELNRFGFLYTRY